MMFKKIARYIPVLVFAVALITSESMKAQTNGVDPRKHKWESQVDSIMCMNVSNTYTGRRNGATMFNNFWYNDAKKYYPVIIESWKYCINKCPNQYNLYKDGLAIYKHMIEKSTTHEDSMTYYNNVIGLYDMKLKNLDAVNASVSNQKLKSSAASLEFDKLKEWNTYIGAKMYDDREKYESLLYNQYEKLQSYLKNAVAKGEVIGGDVTPGDLKGFFNSCQRHYASQVNSIYADADNAKAKEKINSDYKEEYNRLTAIYTERNNAHKERRKTLDTKNADAVRAYNEENSRIAALGDSVVKERKKLAVRRDSLIKELSTGTNIRIGKFKQELIDQYDLVGDVVESQKNNLGKDFKVDPSLSEEEAQLKIDSARTEISKPFNDLIAYCQDLLAMSNIDLDESDMMGIEESYAGKLEQYKDSAMWLARLKAKCEMAGADPTNAFYQKVTEYYDRVASSSSSTGRSVQRNPAYEVLAQAQKEWQTASSVFNSNPSAAKSHYSNAINCFRQAMRLNPGQSGYYSSCISKLNGSIASCNKRIEYNRNMQEQENFWKGGKKK